MPRLVPVLATLALSATLFAAPSGAAELTPAEISSNSVLVDAEKGITYGPESLLDQMRGTMWVEGEGSAGLGKYLQVKFDGEVELGKILIWAGCFIDDDYWKRHNRVKELEFKFPDFTSERVLLEDKMEAQWIELKEPKTVSSVKIYLRSIYKGSTWNDTAITEMRFYDKAGDASGVVAAKEAKASSVYGDDKDYAGSMAIDGWLDSWWVGGEGSGEGDSVEVDLGTDRVLSRFEISTGFDSSESFFKGSNRVGKVTLEFDDGVTKSFDLEDRVGLQSFALDGVRTEKVRAVFSRVVKGASHDDLYVGELRFYE